MSRIRLAFAVCALAATVSACKDRGSVTGPDGVSTTGGARYNGGMAGSGHAVEPADSAAGEDGVGMIGSGHYVANGGIGTAGSGYGVADGGIGMAGSGHAVAAYNRGMAGSGHYVAGEGIGMGGSGGASATSDSTIVTLSGIGAGGSGH